MTDLGLVITRFRSDENGTFGKWTLDGDPLCYTVERPKTGDHPCIAAATYTFNQFNSPSKGDVWLRDDAAAGDGRTMIEIHPANLASQLLGCIAPGETLGMLAGVPAVLNSHKTFFMLKAKLPASFKLKIVEKLL